eukprot:gene9560-12874_t
MSDDNDGSDHFDEASQNSGDNNGIRAVDATETQSTTIKKSKAESPTTCPTCQPLGFPTSSPSMLPSVDPSVQPSSQPISLPSSQPSYVPSIIPSTLPSSYPSSSPSACPSSLPSSLPTNHPTEVPTNYPSCVPSLQPISLPTSTPSVSPTCLPSTQPTNLPSVSPSLQPASKPTNNPSYQPSVIPTSSPSIRPSNSPSARPTTNPSTQPFSIPTSNPTIQPSVTPTFQPTLSPSLMPSQQPTTFPSTQPSKMPTSTPSLQPLANPTSLPTVNPSFNPSNQPSTQPTSYPTPLPSQYENEDDWILRLNYEIKNATLNLDSGFDQLMYVEHIYSYKKIVGTCSKWKTFLLSSSMKKVLSVQRVVSVNLTTIKLLNDRYANDYHIPETVICSNKSLATDIVKLLNGIGLDTRYSKYSINDVNSLQCDGREWKISNCGWNDIQPSVCVDCHNPCSAYCSNTRNLHYLSSCYNNFTINDDDNSQSDSGACYNAVDGRRNGIKNSINILSIIAEDKFGPPAIVMINITAYSNYIEVLAKLEYGGGLHCGYYFPTNAYPASLDIIRFQNNFDFTNEDSNAVVRVLITDLAAVTNYSIFCFTVSKSGRAMPLDYMIQQHNYHVMTKCCKHIALKVSSVVVDNNDNYYNYVSMHISSLPSDTLTIFPQLDGSYFADLFHPSFVVFTDNNFNQNAVLSFAVTKLNIGRHNLSFVLQGSSLAEYDLLFEGYSSNVSSIDITVINQNSNETPPPQLISADYSSGGTYIILTFDSPTDLGISTLKSRLINNITNQFNCSILFLFKTSHLSLCQWINATCAIVYPHYKTIKNSYFHIKGLKEYSIFNELLFDDSLLVGDTILIKQNTIRASRYNNCKNCYSNTSATVNPPLTKVKPNPIINGPLTMGSCNDLSIDISQSIVMGRMWRSLELITVSSQATNTSLDLINAFFANNYQINPPTSIPSTYLEVGVEYSFVLTICDFLSVCSRAIHSVSILNSSYHYGGIPYVTIIGPAFLMKYLEDILEVEVNASIIQCRSNLSSPLIASKQTLKYTWTIKQSNTVVNSLYSSSLNPIFFKISTSKLTIGMVYYVYVSVEDISTGISASHYVRVMINKRNNINTIISNGKYLLVTPNQRKEYAIQLDGSNSFDSDTPKPYRSSYIASNNDGLYIFSDQKLKFSWNCFQLNPVLLSICPNFIVTMNLNNSNYSLSFQPLLANRTSIVTLTVLNPISNYSSSSSIIIETNRLNYSYENFITRSAISFRCKLSATENNDLACVNHILNPTDRLIIDSTIDVYRNSDNVHDLSSSKDFLQSRWIMTLCGQSISLQNMILTPISSNISINLINNSLLSFSFPLLIQSNSLSQSAVYTFQLSNHFEQVSLDVFINDPPRNGILKTDPTFGYTLSTIFYFIASHWQDDDFPLSYMFGYFSQSNSNNTMQIPLSTRSLSTYDKSYLASYLSNEASNITTYVAVYDRLNARSLAYDYAIVYSIPISISNNKSITYFELTHLLEQNRNDYLLSKQLLSVAMIFMNSVNCSLTPAAFCLLTYNRQSCASKSQTCGQCIDNYVGVDGESNSACVSALSRRRRLDDNLTRNTIKSSSFNSTIIRLIQADQINTINHNYEHNNNVNMPSFGIHNQWPDNKRSFSNTNDCSRDDDCDDPYYQCKNGYCQMPFKNCHNISSQVCSKNGICQFININTGEKVSICYLNDTFCEARCKCNSNYYGDLCEVSNADYYNRLNLRVILFTILNNMTSYESSDISRVDYLYVIRILSLFGVSIQENIDDSLQIHWNNMIRVVLEYSESESLSFNDLLETTNLLNILLNIKWERNYQINNQNRRLITYNNNHTRRKLTTNNNNNNKLFNSSLISLFDIISNNLITDQAKVNILYSKMRFVLQPRSIMNTNHIVKLKIPQSTWEEALNSSSPTLEFPISELSNNWFGLYILNKYSYESNINYDVDNSFQKAISNPIFFITGNNLHNNPNSHHIFMKFKINYNQNVKIINPFENITNTLCYDRLYDYNESYSCLTSNQALVVMCDGMKSGIITDRCTTYNVSTICNTLIGHNVTCVTAHYSDDDVTCLCDSYYYDSYYQTISQSNSSTKSILTFYANYYNTSEVFDSYFTISTIENIEKKSFIVYYSVSLLSITTIVLLFFSWTYENKNRITLLKHQQNGKIVPIKVKQTRKKSYDTNKINKTRSSNSRNDNNSAVVKTQEHKSYVVYKFDDPDKVEEDLNAALGIPSLSSMSYTNNNTSFDIYEQNKLNSSIGLTNQRSCEQSNTCQWTTRDHYCYYNQPPISLYYRLLFAISSLFCSIPVSKYFEKCLIILWNTPVTYDNNNKNDKINNDNNDENYVKDNNGNNSKDLSVINEEYNEWYDTIKMRIYHFTHDSSIDQQVDNLQTILHRFCGRLPVKEKKAFM